MASVEQSIDLGVPAARAWALVSTSAGLSSWFVTADVDTGPPGTVTLQFGPGAAGTMPIQVCEPPHRIRFGAAEGDPGRAHEFMVDEGAPGRATVRVIDSGVTDAEAAEVRKGWTAFLNRLRVAAEHPLPSG